MKSVKNLIGRKKTLHRWWSLSTAPLKPDPCLRQAGPLRSGRLLRGMEHSGEGERVGSGVAMT